MKFTAAEIGWVKIFGVLAVVIGVFFVVRPSLTSISPTQNEPLADAETLQKLIAGEPILEPTVAVGQAEFHGTKVTPPTLASLSGPLSQPTNVLGATADEKHIEVDLAKQRVYAFEGTTKVYEFPTSTGKWGRTPTGEFRIWVKMKSVLMAGGSGADAYYLPNVPYTMFFSNNEIAASRGYSLHGTYWHDNFGHPMSHGCVNLRTEDAKTLFNWVTPTVTDPKAWSTLATAQNPGTKIVIYGEPPEE